jgi:hypothetical protein
MAPGLVQDRVTVLARGSVKVEGFGDGSTRAKATIAKLRLTLPPVAGCRSVIIIWANSNQAGWRRAGWMVTPMQEKS